jgi:hypothetical protein
MACAALFDHKTRDDEAARKIDFELVKADFLVEATEQFEKIWQDADESEQQVLSQIALNGNLTGQQRYLVRELQRKGYLTDDNPPAPFSQAFAEFILSKNPDADLTPGPSPTRREETPGQPTKQTSFLNRVMGLFKSGK